jgi:hypothetical protein
LKNDKTDRAKESRLMRHKQSNTPAPFVELDAGEYLLDILMEAGPSKSSPMGGAEALDWRDLQAYDSFSAGMMEHWEALLVIQMSAAFVRGLDEGKSPFSKSPLEREKKNDPQ